MPTSIIFQNTEDPAYAEKRKILASAFFKNKVTSMIELIKKVTTDFINDLVAKGTHQVDIIKLTQDL
jgi:cytochrome P450